MLRPSELSLRETLMEITHLNDTHNAPLGSANAVAVPLGEPVSHTRTYAVERADKVETGIWECSPGRWRRQIVEQEFCHFVTGSGTFTPDGSTPIAFRAGDAFLLPQNSLGVWDIKETVRKTFVIIKRD